MKCVKAERYDEKINLFESDNSKKYTFKILFGVKTKKLSEKIPQT